MVSQFYRIIKTLIPTEQALGNKLEEMLIEDQKHLENVVNLVNDPDGQRELLQQDEEEDFLDEGTSLYFTVVLLYRMISKIGGYKLLF